MPQTVFAKGKEFSFPDETTKDQIADSIDEYFDSVSKKSSPGIIGEALGFFDTAKTVATSAIAEPVSGLAGLAALPFKGEDAGNVVDNVRDTLTLQPTTDAGKRNLKDIGDFLTPISDMLSKAEQVSGDFGFDLAGPVGGAIASALPTAAIEALGLSAPKNISRAVSKKSDSLLKESASKITEANNSIADQENIAETLSRGNAEDISEIVKADPSIVKAFEEIDIEPLASHISQNPKFRSIEGGFAAFPGSELGARAKEITKSVSEKADNLIERYGGTTDKSELSARFKQETIKNIEDLFIQTDELYDQVDSVVDKKSPIQASNTIALLEQMRDESGGLSKMPTVFRRMLKDLTDVDEPVAYGYLVRQRQDIGRAAKKAGGVFKDQNEGILKKLYGKLRLDQDNAVPESVLPTLKQADALTVKRKILEDSTKKLLGRDLQNSLMTKISSGLKSLKKGDTDKFDDIIENIPKSFRQEAVVSSLNDIFRGAGVNQQGMNVTQFSKFMDDLERSKTSKRSLYKHLPEKARVDLDNLHKVAKAISVAQQDIVKTGVITGLFDPQAGLFNKLWGSAVTTSIGKITGSPASALAVEHFLKAKTKKSQTVGDMLADPAFRSILTQSVSDGVKQGGRISKELEKAEELFKKSKKYKRWADTLDTNDRAKLASLGFVHYLFDDKTQQDNETFLDDNGVLNIPISQGIENDNIVQP